MSSTSSVMKDEPAVLISKAIGIPDLSTAERQGLIADAEEAAYLVIEVKDIGKIAIAGSNLNPDPDRYAVSLYYARSTDRVLPDSVSTVWFGGDGHVSVLHVCDEDAKPLHLQLRKKMLEALRYLRDYEGDDQLLANVKVQLTEEWVNLANQLVV